MESARFLFTLLTTPRKVYNSPMNVSDAITAFETASTGLNGSQTNQAAAQARFVSAQATKAQADLDEATAVTTFNAACDALIAALQAAKIGTSTGGGNPPAGPGAPPNQ